MWHPSLSKPLSDNFNLTGPYSNGVLLSPPLPQYIHLLLSISFPCVLSFLPSKMKMYSEQPAHFWDSAIIRCVRLQKILKKFSCNLPANNLLAKLNVSRQNVEHRPQLVFVNLLKKPMNRFPAWRAGATTLFDVLARQDTVIDSVRLGIDSWSP